MPYDNLKVTYDDFDGDAQTASIRTLALSEFADYAAMETALGALQTNLDLWVNGRNHRVDHVITKLDNGPGKASTPAAQKVLQLILETQDTVTGVIYRERVPMPDMAKANDVGGDAAWIATGSGSNSLTVINPAHAGWDALKTAYDACGCSPEGNPAILIRAYVEE